MTKVLVRPRPFLLLAGCLFATACALSQPSPPGSHCPQTTSDLYSRLRSVPLDPARIYRIRDASISRPNLNITLDDGTLAFTEDVCGRITGALFVGDGEVLLQPPTRIERGSLALFTGMAILEEQFSSAYLRFNDDTADSLQPFLSPEPDAAAFFHDSNDIARQLAEYDALRLFLDFSHFLPPSSADAPRFPSLLHLHLVGKKLGTFEVFWDGAIAEPLWAGKLSVKDDLMFFDIWTSFTPTSPAEPTLTSRNTPPREHAPQENPPRENAPRDLVPRENHATISAFRIDASIHPPSQLEASAEMTLRVRESGERTLLFELSRYLKVESVTSSSHPLDFIQNPAMEGSQLNRRGNDLVAVVFPRELAKGQDLKLKFTYAGDVLSDAGNGLLYVGARGNWYPSFGLSPASFDIQFRYPAAWTLVATGKRVSSSNSPPPADSDDDARSSHWVSDRPIPLAGFNLGKYLRAEARAGKILVEAYGTKGVEKTFLKPAPEIIAPPRPPSRRNPSIPIIVPPATPSPARDLQSVANRAAKAIDAFSEWFGPYPYTSLALTQMPGNLSQGWPGLVFLSSYAFLSPQEQTDLHLNEVTRVLDSQVLVHETAHQWWGDLVLWKTYHDQWLAEALANYSSLLLLEAQNPAQFHQAMEKYRADLLSKNKDDEWLRDAGPVTLGQRLTSSHFPDAYEAISYERGTWLMHMLRCMLRDSEPASRLHADKPSLDEPFFRGLRKVRERYAGKTISTREFIAIFEDELPRPLWYDTHHKLDWFVDSWIDGTAIPEFQTRDIHITEKSAATVVSGVIVQKDAPENLVTALPVYAETSSNTMIFLGQVFADGPETSFHLNAPAGIHKILLDPKQTILTAPK